MNREAVVGCFRSTEYMCRISLGWTTKGKEVVVSDIGVYFGNWFSNVCQSKMKRIVVRVVVRSTLSN